MRKLLQRVTIFAESNVAIAAIGQAWNQAGVDQRTLARAGYAVDDDYFMAHGRTRQFVDNYGAAVKDVAVGNVVGRQELIRRGCQFPGETLDNVINDGLVARHNVAAGLYGDISFGV